MAYAKERIHRLAELDAFLGIGHRVLQRAARQADGARRGVGAGEAKAEGDALHRRPGFRIAGDRLARRRPDIVEIELPGLPAEIADLGDGAAGAALGQLALGFFHRDRGGAGATAWRIRIVDAAEHADIVGAVGEGAPVLGPGDDPVVAVAARPALDAGEVRAGAPLRQGRRAQVAALGHGLDLARRAPPPPRP